MNTKIAEKNQQLICAYIPFYETKGGTIARSVHCLVCRLHHDSEHHCAFMATNQLGSFQASMNNNVPYDRSTNVLELEVNVPRKIGILRDAPRRLTSVDCYLIRRTPICNIWFLVLQDTLEMV